jgi:hypothetical protein
LTCIDSKQNQAATLPEEQMHEGQKAKFG